MTTLEREMLLDTLEALGYKITINEAKLIKAEKDKTTFFRVFIGKKLECVLTLPGYVSGANQLAYYDLLEYIDTYIEG